MSSPLHPDARPPSTGHGPLIRQQCRAGRLACPGPPLLPAPGRFAAPTPICCTCRWNRSRCATARQLPSAALPTGGWPEPPPWTWSCVRTHPTWLTGPRPPRAGPTVRGRAPSGSGAIARRLPGRQRRVGEPSYSSASRRASCSSRSPAHCCWDLLPRRSTPTVNPPPSRPQDESATAEAQGHRWRRTVGRSAAIERGRARSATPCPVLRVSLPARTTPRQAASVTGALARGIWLAPWGAGLQGFVTRWCAGAQPAARVRLWHWRGAVSALGRCAEWRAVRQHPCPSFFPRG